MEKINFTFDLWETLIHPNRAMLNARNEMILDILKDLNVTVNEDDLTSEFKAVKQWHDDLNESLQKCVPPAQLFFTVLHNVKVPKHILNYGLIFKIMNNNHKLFLDEKYRPSLIDGVYDTLKTLRQERTKVGTIGLICNTGFVGGNTLKRLLSDLEISHFFDFMLFSDLMLNLECKPNVEIFYNARRLSERNLKIVHVGDNLLTDGECIKDRNFEFCLINKPVVNFTKVLSYINNHE